MTILVIEDEHGIREGIQLILEDRGHRVTAAKNGSEGLALLPADLIILDLMMPVMDGERFLQELSERTEYSMIPVIVMTASRHIPTSVLPIRILRKPIDLDYLLKLVEETQDVN